MPLIIPADQYRAVQPGVFSAPGARTPENYVQCIEQFQVQSHVRYKRNAQGKTACNLYAWDVGVAMKAPLAHWVDKTSLEMLPLYPTNIKADGTVGGGVPMQTDNRMELSGNGVCYWLQTTGVQKYGWEMVSPVEAGNAASKGFLTVVTWVNVGPDGVYETKDDGIGHIGVIRPSMFPNLRMAQAGASNFVNGTVANGFGVDPKVTGHMVYLTHRK